MPKSKMEIMRREAKRIEQDDSLRASLGTLKAAGRMTWDDVAELIGLTPPTLRKRMNEPGSMRLCELRRIEQVMAERGIPFSLTLGRDSA